MKRRLISIILLGALLSTALLATPLAVAAEEPIQLVTEYSKLEGNSGDNFEFEVRILYTGNETLVFDLSATGPQYWMLSISPSYPKDKRIQNVRIEPFQTSPETIAIQVSTPFWLTTEPGDYDITLQVSSGEISESITMQAVITARHAIDITPVGGLYSTDAEAGKDTVFALELTNSGTAPVNNVKFSSRKPDGWEISFLPDGITTVGARDSVTVDATIQPPEKAISGDYLITLETSAEEVSSSPVSVRVSVETRPIWGWVGIIIIVIVVAILGFGILRFSRR